jgi:AcrR family transcriptional regulator
MIATNSSRRRRKAERPNEILHAALEVFSTHGFAATRLEDVAARAGITKGTIYVYFGSKEALFIAALKEKTGPVFEHLAGLMKDPQGSALEILRRHLAFAAEQMIEDPCGRDIVQILLAEGHRFPEVVDEWYAEVMAPALVAVGDILRYGVRRGEFRATSLEAFPQLIMAPIILLTTWKGLFGERRPLESRAFFDAAFDLLAKGLLDNRT